MENYISYSQIIEALNSKKTTVTALVDQYLKNIDHKKHLNAFLEVWAEEAKAAAQQIDKYIADIEIKKK